MSEPNQRPCPKCGKSVCRYGEPLGDWRDWCDECRDVEVVIKFDIAKMSAEQRQTLYRLRKDLSTLGINFDTGSDGSVMDWEFDWSLTGPVQVLFKQFTRDNPKNRYTREPVQVDPKDRERALEEMDSVTEDLTLRVN